MSKKPISIKEKPSKKALLDELESIKHLLDDEDSNFEPPLLTQEVTSDNTKRSSVDDIDFDNDLPVLTDSLDLNEEDIPTLEASVEEEDIVSRAMKARSQQDLSSQTTPTLPKTNSLFDDDYVPKDSSASEQLSPEMLALNAIPKKIIKPIAPKAEEATKSTASVLAETKIAKPAQKQFLSLEEELETLAKNIVNETPIETTLDEDHVNETLKEFDDYLEDDTQLGHDDNQEDENLPNDGLLTEEITLEDAEEQEEIFLADPSQDEQYDEALLAENDESELTSSGLTAKDINNDSEEIIEDAQKDSTDASEESLLAAAILEVTDSITDGKLSEQVQESLAKNDAKNEPESKDNREPKDSPEPSESLELNDSLELSETPNTKEHQPSLFDSSDSVTQTDKSEVDNDAISKKVESTKPATEPEEAISATPIAKSPSSSSSSSKITAQANSRKTENPFLPKHIRERLHTNRTLQQEIDDSSAAQASLNTTTGEQASTRAYKNSDHTQQEKAVSPGSTQEDRVIEEVLGSVLPKIESELRQKIRELIDQEKSSD
ncbi:MAG: hypothetical protein K6L75_07315 [Cellvibrionaceae bacterium]